MERRRMTGDRLLDALFRPRRVAVYGASARDASKLGNTLLRNVAGTPCGALRTLRFAHA